MKHSFIFNGKNSLDYGIIIATHPESRHAERRGKTSTIPGRHGALYRDEAAFSTYEISYDVLLDARNVGDMYHLGRDLSAWLLNASGYCRLEDTYEPEHYRMARYVGSPDVANILFKFGRAELEFEVQPQRYLKSGEQEIEITADQSTVYNPTNQNAFPLIKVAKTATPGESGGEQVEPVPVELTWTANSYIAGSQWPADQVHRVQTGSGTFGTIHTSQQINVSGYETAIITAKSHDVNYYNAGVRGAVCYTFLSSAGAPVGSAEDVYTMVEERVAIPKSARYLVICDLNNPNYAQTPAVTLLPEPTYVEGDTSSVTINGRTATIDFSDRSTVYLDCDAHDAFFEDGSNANAIVRFTETGNNYATFPQLDPGDNLVSLTGEGMAVTIKPRWWVL